MKKEDLESTTNSIQEKLGKENYAIISDDIAKIILANNQTNEQIAQQQEDYTKLKEKNEQLIETNGILMQQIPMGQEDKPQEDKKEKFNFKNAFDEKGNFI